MRALYACIFLLLVQSVNGQLLMDERNSVFSSDDPSFYERMLMCTMTADTTSTLPAICFGTATGSVFLTVNSATQPISLYLDGTGAPYSGTGISNALAAGNYFVEVVDGMGCRDTVNFTITQPTPLTISASATDAKCYGQPSGTGIASAQGGTLPFGYQWEPCIGGPVVVGAQVNTLLAGCYKVTVTDKQGCATNTQVTVGQPTQITYTSTVDSVRCFQGIDGRATISATGGAGGFTYLWDNGQTTTTATGLDARFHYVTITDITTCSVVAEVNVPGPERVIIDSISRVQPNCFGGSNGTATAFVHGGTAPYNYFWSAGSPNGATTTNLSSGLFRVTVADSYGCRDSLAFIMNTPPPMSIATQNIVHETCLGACNGSARINVTGGVPSYSYQWSNPAIPPTANQPTTLCAGQYTVTISDAANCTQTVQFTINAGANLQTQFSGTNPKCADSHDGAITATIFGGQSPISYQWSTGQSTATINGLECGTYQIIATDSRNCKDTAMYLLSCPPPIVLDSMSQVAVKCFGDQNGQLTAWFSGGTNPLSYDWSLQGTQNTPTAQNLGSGSYTITVTDFNGCTNTANGTINAPLALSATQSTTPVLCYGASTGEAHVIPIGGTGSYTYLWNTGSTADQLLQQAAGTYTVTVSDQNGCTHVLSSLVITQPLAPLQVAVQLSQQPCFGSGGGTAVATASGGTAGYTYQWSNGSSGSSASQLAAGQYNLIVSDANACTQSGSINVVTYDSIAVQASFNQISCFGQQDAQITIQSVSGGAGSGQLNDYQYTWSNGQNTSSLTSLPEGTYTVTVTDAQGCTNIKRFDLFGAAPIIPFIQPTWLLCHGDENGVLRLDSINSLQPIVNIRWSNGSIDPQQIINLKAGVYSVIVTDVNGCTGETTTSVFEPAQLKIQAFNGTPPRCAGESNGSIEAVVAGGTPPYAYSWSVPQNTAVINQLSIGEYKVVVTDANGCTLRDSVFLDQPKALSLEAETTDIRCFGANDGIIKLKSDGGTRPYSYSIWADSSTLSAHFYQLAPGVYEVVSKDAKGCTASSEVELFEPEKVFVELGGDTTLLFGDSLLITAITDNAIGQPEYTWRTTTTSDTITCADAQCSTIWALPLFDAVYSVRMRDSMGCITEDIKRIKVEKPRAIYVPTGFTPNDDQDNDLLNVFAKTRMIAQINTLRIYDRNGAQVFALDNFQPNDLSIGWDGTVRGKPCEQGVYTYFLEALYKDGHKDLVSGTTTLIR